RCIRPLYLEVGGTIGDLMSKGIEECKKDGAFLPIIRSDQENSMFNDIALNMAKGITYYPYLILGMVCNSSTRRLEWMDGPKITYTKKNFNASFDCVSTNWLVDSELHYNEWYLAPSTFSTSWTVLCVAEPSEPISTSTSKSTTTAKLTTITTVKDSTNSRLKLRNTENNLLNYVI
ncbi:hypothetical protein PFISCL1PPCAC_17695, partial [Pristionchus fissidentatus]